MYRASAAPKPRIMEAKFDSTCSACSCRITKGQMIQFTPGHGSTKSSARHQYLQDCTTAKANHAAAKLSTEQSNPTIDLMPIVEFLQAARTRGLKQPKLRILAPDRVSEIVLGITKGGNAPGSISVVHEKDGFLGCVRTTGHTTSKLAQDTNLQQHLLVVAMDPVSAAKEYAAIKCRCCFCGKELTDAGSVEVGYGPVCAKHWGLPHTAFGVPILRPVPGSHA